MIGDPNVWAPLLTATLLQIDDLDHEISDRLREDTPLFGSAQNAADLSDNFRDLTEVGYISTALMVPGPETTGAWISNKVVLVGTESLVVSMGQMVSGEVKSTTGRERPNKTNNRSFASGHTSTATMQAQMANLNVDHLQIEATTKRGLNFGFNSVAALTGWARVEAGEHYPSDVLAGWALGYLMSNFGKEIIKPDRLRIMVRPRANPDAGGIELIIKF